MSGCGRWLAVTLLCGALAACGADRAEWMGLGDSGVEREALEPLGALSSAIGEAGGGPALTMYVFPGRAGDGKESARTVHRITFTLYEVPKR